MSLATVSIQNNLIFSISESSKERLKLIIKLPQQTSLTQCSYPKRETRIFEYLLNIFIFRLTFGNKYLFINQKFEYPAATKIYFTSREADTFVVNVCDYTWREKFLFSLFKIRKGCQFEFPFRGVILIFMVKIFIFYTKITYFLENIKF